MNYPGKRFSLMLLAVATITTAPNAQSAPQRAGVDYYGVDPQIVAAWQKVGAELSLDSGVPTFRFNGVPRAAALDSLPAPNIHFGVSFDYALLREEHFKAIGRWTSLSEFRCYSCTIGDGSGLRHFTALAQLRSVDFNRLPPEAHVDALGALTNLRRLQLRSASGVQDQGLAWLSELKQLEELRLPYTPISAETLQAAARLPQLTALFLQENGNRLELSGAHLEILASMPALETLSITGSNLDDEGLETIAGIKSLRELSLSGSLVTGSSVGSLSKAPLLTSLLINSPALSIGILEGLPALTRLESLQLGGKAITDQWLPAITRLKNLQDLGLLNSSVTDTGVRSLSALTNLRALRFNGTPITGHTFGELALLTRLEELRLGSTSLDDAGLSAIAVLNQLKILGLHNTRISDAGLEALRRLPQLENLVVGGDITNAGVRTLSKIRSLKVLNFDLDGPTISDAGIRSLAALQDLKELYLPAEARVTIGSVAELVKALPNLVIDGRAGSVMLTRLDVEAAMNVTDPAARLTALQRIATTSPGAAVDARLLSTLAASFPARVSDIDAVLERLLNRLPEGATPDRRFQDLMNAVRPLLDARIRLDRIEPHIKDAFGPIIDSRLRAMGLAAIAKIDLARGATASARKAIEDGLALQPGTMNREIAGLIGALAELEVHEGDADRAYDHFITAAAAGTLTATQDVSFRSLYRRRHGTESDLDRVVNRRHRELYPSPIKPAKLDEPGNGRVVLLELFTGSGCGPCVASDLALEAVLERYPADSLVAVAYHLNVPLPDPMVIANGIRRQVSYGESGTPTVRLNGALFADEAGGARAAAPKTYAAWVRAIDEARRVPPAASISIAASGFRDSVTARASVTGVSSGAKDLRLHLLLVERELGFLGENGLRPHSMVVRGVAAAGGLGLPVRGDGTIEFTFDLKAIAKDIADTLATATRPVPGRTYLAQGRAQTAIDPPQLVVVGFIQQGGAPKDRPNVLQAAQARVVISK